MAVIDFPTSPINGQIFAAPNGVTYRWQSTPAPGLWLSGSGVASVSAGTTPPVSPAPNALWWNSDAITGGGQLYVYYNDGSTTQWVPASPGVGSGSVVQTVSFQTGAVATGTTMIPNDDTIPQITEGTEFMTLAITPKSATSKLIIEVAACVSCSSVAGVIVTLHQDSTANASATGYWVCPIAVHYNVVSFKHTMISGTTSTTTFRVRVGPTAAGTITFNGQSGARILGGALASSIVIQEVL